MKTGTRDVFLNVACHGLRRLPFGRRSLFQACRLPAGSPDRFVIQTDGFYFVIDCRDQDVAMRVALNRAYEPAVAALFLANLSPGGIAVDAGANKGYYTILALRKVGSTGRVIAY